ncbi:MAG: hypothetical protein ABI591_21415 [Kofleriaceae bacterium]
MHRLVALLALSGCDSVFGLDTVGVRNGMPVFVEANGVARSSSESPVQTLEVSLDTATQDNLIVVAICQIPHNGVTGISDDNQTTYTNLPIGASTPALQSYVYWSRVTKTRSPFKVRVTFDAEGGYSPDLRVAEYANIAELMPVENAGAQTDPSAASIKLMIDVPVVPALVFASSCVGSQATDVTGFTSRVFTTPNGDLIADQIVTTAGPLAVTAGQTDVSGLILQLVAFAGGPLP